MGKFAGIDETSLTKETPRTSQHHSGRSIVQSLKRLSYPQRFFLYQTAAVLFVLWLFIVS
ncbi:hypothetical protein A0E43_16125 [Pectobacterium cacticida]